MIHCYLLFDDFSFQKELNENLNKILKNLNLSSNLICINTELNFDVYQVPFEGISILFFMDTIDELLLQKIALCRPDINMIVFSSGKYVSYYYKYHIFSCMMVNNYIIHLENALILLIEKYKTSKKNKLTFISNKKILSFEISQIKHLKFENRKLFLFADSKCFQINGNLKDYNILIEKYNFQLVKRSRLINPNYKNYQIQT